MTWIARIVSDQRTTDLVSKVTHTGPVVYEKVYAMSLHTHFYFLIYVVCMRKYCVGEKICLEILTDLRPLSPR
jgi:hypothetical protein